jgi:hypothetical protein
LLSYKIKAFVTKKRLRRSASGPAKAQRQIPCKILGRGGFGAFRAAWTAKNPLFSVDRNLVLQIFTKQFLAESGNIKALQRKKPENSISFGA